MNVITLDYPLESLPGLPVQEGQHFQGYVRGGKVHVTVQLSEAGQAGPLTRKEAAKHFVEKWSGAGKLLPQGEVEPDSRLAYLTAKHLR